jgi:hypothetical protein
MGAQEDTGGPVAAPVHDAAVTLLDVLQGRLAAVLAGFVPV